MTFPDDSVQLEFEHGTIVRSCLEIGLCWPPPEIITAWGFDMNRTEMSDVTDKQKKEADVFRLATYTIHPQYS